MEGFKGRPAIQTFQASPSSLRCPSTSYPPLSSAKIGGDQMSPTLRSSQNKQEATSRQSVLPSIHLTGASIQGSLETESMTNQKDRQNRKYFEGHYDSPSRDAKCAAHELATVPEHEQTIRRDEFGGYAPQSGLASPKYRQQPGTLAQQRSFHNPLIEIPNGGYNQHVSKNIFVKSGSS